MLGPTAYHNLAHRARTAALPPHGPAQVQVLAHVLVELAELCAAQSREIEELQRQVNHVKNVPRYA
jgi:alcohol dehydrogenase class IV